MDVVGAILQGIPSLPFLLLAADYAIRISPRMERVLRRQPWVATLLDQAEAADCCLQMDRHALNKMLPIILLATSVILIVHPPMPVVVPSKRHCWLFLASETWTGRWPGGRDQTTDWDCRDLKSLSFQHRDGLAHRLRNRMWPSCIVVEDDRRRGSLRRQPP